MDWNTSLLFETYHTCLIVIDCTGLSLYRHIRDWQPHAGRPLSAIFFLDSCLRAQEEYVVSVAVIVLCYYYVLWTAVLFCCQQ